MSLRLTIFVACIIVLVHYGCQRELSFEGGASLKQAVGTIQKNNTGGCLPVAIKGLFIAGETLTDSNSIIVKVDITQPGSYDIKTKEINGYYFTAKGNFPSTGQYELTLFARGKPIKTSLDEFNIFFNQSSCQVSVPVTTKSNDAKINIKTATGDCLGFSVNGQYIEQTLTELSNTIDLSVEVKQIGSFSISTATVNGFFFKAEGYLTNTGRQTIKFFAQGTPQQPGISIVNFIVGTDTCKIEVLVEAINKDDYFPRTANSYWTYEIDNNANDTARFFVSPATKLISGNTFNIFMVSRASTVDSSGYYRRSGSKYFRYSDIGDFIGFDQPQWQEYIFLDDALAVGSIFQSKAFNGTVTIAPLPPQPMTVRFVNKVLTKGSTLNITSSSGTKSFTEVIGIEEKFERLVGSNWVDITSQVGSFIKYYSKNVGMIRYEAYNSAGNLATQVNIREYKVY